MSPVPVSLAWKQHNSPRFHPHNNVSRENNRQRPRKKGDRDGEEKKYVKKSEKKERFRHLLMMRVELGIREIILCPGSAAADKRTAATRAYADNVAHMGGQWTCCRKGEGSGGPSRAHPPCVSTSGSPGVGTGPGTTRRGRWTEVRLPHTHRAAC